MRDKVNGISEDKYEEDKEYDGFDYGKIISIKTKEGVEIPAEQIENNSDNIDIDDIVSVRYQAKSFFYWPSFPDFAGKRLSEIEKQPLYKKVDGVPTEDGKGKIGDSKALVDDSWYSFDYEEGFIFSQEKVGEEVDMSNPPDHPLINAIGMKLSDTGKASELRSELEELGFKVEINGSESGNVSSVNIEYTGSDDRTSVMREEDNGTAFKNDPNIKITIATKEGSSQKTTQSNKSRDNNKDKDKKKPSTTEKSTKEQKKKKSKSTTEDIDQWDFW